MMTESEEKIYEAGKRSANLSLLRRCLSELGYDTEIINEAKLIKEREEVIQLMRTVCPEFGDNNWSNDLHLVDIIDKHLLNYVLDR